MVGLIGKRVEVFANSITYIGRLVEAGEKELYLESESGWIVIPMEKVISVRETEG